ASIARDLGSSPWARRKNVRFDAVLVRGALDLPAPRGSEFDIAAHLGEPPRLARLAECLASAAKATDAWLLGPWLGVIPGAAERLRALLGRPCGETTSPPGGPAGARFDASRDALLSSLGVGVRRERVAAVERRGSCWLIAPEEGQAPPESA